MITAKHAVYICAEMFSFDKSTGFDQKIMYIFFPLENSLAALAVNALRTAFKQPNHSHKYECAVPATLMEFACVYQGAEFGSCSKKH